MGIDFLRFLSPEARARIERQKANHAKDVSEARAMSDEELCEKVEYYLSQSEFPHRWLPGDPVYDGVIAHVMIPELMRRLKKGK